MYGLPVMTGEVWGRGSSFIYKLLGHEDGTLVVLFHIQNDGEAGD